MKRSFVILVLVGCALAQEPRDAYQEAFRSWRRADTALETDAATAKEALGIRADKVSAEAAKYMAARNGLLDFLREATQEKARSLEPLLIAAPPDLVSRTEANVSTESTAASSSMAAIGSDPDRGLQRLRQSLESERSALLALTSAMAVRRGAMAGVAQTSEAAELARTRVVEHYQTLVTGLEAAVQQSDQQAAEWTAYYKVLADGARGIIPSGVPGRPSIQTRGITPVPLSRYIGEWTYPRLNPLFSGPEPQFAELVVREDNRRAAGTLTVRFKLPPGSSLDPGLHGDFTGTFENVRNQVFSLETNDGGKGKIELIPGPAFNLLEVNLTIEPRPGKVQQANFLLVKK
jgi:hypothetical protein